jgi:hypothetical protein
MLVKLTGSVGRGAVSIDSNDRRWQRSLALIAARAVFRSSLKSRIGVSFDRHRVKIGGLRRLGRFQP